MTVSKTDLQQAERRFRDAQRLADVEREARNELVRRALAEGWKVDELAEVLGLTKGRISQIRTAR